MADDAGGRVRRLKMRHLAVIHEIGRTGSLQKASERLSLSQSAVSKALAEAETLLDAQLFERTAFGSRPTLQGSVILRYSSNVMAELDRAEEEREALLKGETGKLTVGIFTPVALWEALAQTVNAFIEAAPRVKLSLRQASMEKLLSELDADDLDLVIGRWSHWPVPGAIATETLFSDGGPVFVARAAHPLMGKSVTFAELVKFPWCLPEMPSVLYSALQDELVSAGLKFPERVVHSHVYTVNMAMCARSDTIALLPAFAVKQMHELHGVCRIDCPLSLTTAPLSAMWKPESPGREIAARFIAQLRRAIEG
ncbi:LysR family transcriptional regulator [Paraburkholderia terrae]|uniref:HTH lysR-type domain-containing protein n=1 Tax=Paraburkholderia terrae TaxID=311230 RepID=A0A2I8F0Y6_9BURK|nr:LysR family transcriptional regulator [Paraburkholderia terrae]AUT65473.1 hypothetical protein C2L65_38745 [Paraburkholderia terrae]